MRVHKGCLIDVFRADMDIIRSRIGSSRFPGILKPRHPAEIHELLGIGCRKCQVTGIRVSRKRARRNKRHGVIKLQRIADHVHCGDPASGIASRHDAVTVSAKFFGRVVDDLSELLERPRVSRIGGRGAAPVPDYADRAGASLDTAPGNDGAKGIPSAVWVGKNTCSLRS